MRRTNSTFLFGLVTALVFVCGSMVLAQDPEEQPEAAEETPPPRVVGQLQTQEEYDAWLALQAATSPILRTQLAENFLETFAESGMTPFIHDILAQLYLQSNDFDKFVHHAEESLEEVPENPTLLIRLAYAYAERGQNDLAIERGDQGLDYLESMVRPENFSKGEWEEQKDQLAAEASYSLGLAYLKKALELNPDQRAESSHLQNSMANLEKAIDLDPAFDAAYFRLGFVHTIRNDADQAVLNHARAVALDGVAAHPAREQMEQVHDFIQEHRPESEIGQKSIADLITEQREFVEQKISDRRTHYSRLVDQD